jgi:hypothetical protein
VAKVSHYLSYYRDVSNLLWYYVTILPFYHKQDKQITCYTQYQDLPHPPSQKRIYTCLDLPRTNWAWKSLVYSVSPVNAVKYMSDRLAEPLRPNSKSIWDIHLNHSENSVVAEHRIDFNISMIKVMAYMECSVKEEREIWLDPNNLRQVSPWARHLILWLTCLNSPMKCQWESKAIHCKHLSVQPWVPVPGRYI